MQVSIPNPFSILLGAQSPSVKVPVILPEIAQEGNLRGKRVLLRASLNMPVKGGVVTNDYRLRAVLPTIEYLREKGAKTIIMAHIGRDPELSIRPVYKELSKHVPATFVSEVVGEHAKEAVSKLEDGGVLMLENVRSHPGEESNDVAFAEMLASMGDIYVNAAFAVCHREHASIVGVPKLLPHYVGFHFMKEIEALTKALTPKRPSLFILGGAKFGTKKPLIEKFLAVYDFLFVGGAIANDFFSAMGYSVGVSATSKDARGLTDILGNPRIIIPIDVCVSKDGQSRITKVSDVREGEYISDIGPESLEILKERIEKSKYVLWNGPLGDRELGFTKGTEEIAQAVASADAEVVIGGGDTIAAIAGLNLEDELTFVSTGGGAMLQFLANETLPGIEVLKK